jgi:Uma2 family endonuclease
VSRVVSKDEKPAAPVPTVPTVDAWRAMTPDERLSFQLRVLDALSDPVAAMSEGRPHKKAKSRALDALSLHFKTTGRVIYLAEEMAVLYPGEKAFTPDLLAVLDVEEPEDDERMSWVVADEGRGLDLVIEVLHKGDRDKDLVENVELYAHLGIPEYFVYDRGRQQIHGFRLSTPAPGRYQRIVPQLGHYRSTVLGLDLAIIGNALRFLAGEAELPGSDELLRRIQGMMESLDAKAEQAEAQAEQARNRAEQAQAQGERSRAARDVLTVLRVRGIAVSPAERDRILAETDADRLERWLEKAAVAGSLVEVLAEPRPG